MTDIKKESKDLELFHYGVKGMKWGVRREDRDRDGRVDSKADKAAKKTQRRETKAKKHDARAEALRTKVSDIQSAEAKNFLDRSKQNRQIKNLTKRQQQAMRDAEAKRAGKLTRRQKQVLIGASVVAAYAGYKVSRNFVESGEVNRLLMKGKAYMDGKDGPSFNKKAAYASKIFDADQLKVFVADGINDPGSFGGKVNCRRCTFTYEMRRRGYDVKATKTTTGRGQEATGLWNALKTQGSDDLVRPGATGVIGRMAREMYNRDVSKSREDAPFVDFLQTPGSNVNTGLKKIFDKTTEGTDSGESISRKVFDALSSEPNGSRGELGIKWKIGGAHSIAYEIVNNKPVIFDTQLGKYFKTPEDFLKYASNMSESGFTRLDNLPLNEDFLMRWAKNA